jgi:hypothetical protein
LLLLIVLDLHFQNYRFPVRQPQEIVWAKLVNDPFEPVRNLKTDVVIFINSARAWALWMRPWELGELFR